MSSAILLMNSECVWIEDTHACVFVLILGGLRGGIQVLEKLFSMMFLADTMKASHVSNMTDFM